MGMKQMVVLIEWDDNNLAERPMTIDDIKLCLYSEVHTFKGCYQIKELRINDSQPHDVQIIINLAIDLLLKRVELP